MTHDKHIELSAYLDGELDAQARATVEKRLQRDNDYAREYARLMRIRTMMQQNTPKAGFHDRLMSRIEAEPAGSSRKAWGWHTALAVAAGIAVVAALAWLTMPAGEPPGGEQIPLMAAGGTPSEPPAAPANVEDAQPEEETAAREAIEPVRPVPLQLAGTVTGPMASATLTNTETGRTGTYRAGDEVLPGTVLERIEHGSVVLARGDERVTLTRGGGPVVEEDSIAGLWEGEMGLAGQMDAPNQRGRLRAEVSENQRVITISLTFEAEREPMFRLEGTRVGNQLDLTAVTTRTGEAVFEGSGEIEDDRIRIMAKPIGMGDGEEAYLLKLTRIPDAEAQALLAHEALVKERTEEVERMAGLLMAYVNRHNGAIPQRLQDAAPSYGPDSTLFDDKEGRSIKYHYRAVGDEGQELGPAPKWSSFRTDLPMPDRLLAYDQALQAHYGRPSPLEQFGSVLTVDYDDPHMQFTVDRKGGVRRTTSDGQGPDSQEQAARLRAHSQNNLKQLGLVLKMFENEWNGYLPGGWWSVYPEYLVDLNVLNSPVDEPGRTSYELLFPAVHLQQFAEEVVSQVEPDIDLNTPAAMALVQSRLPVVVENVEHPPGGRNVLFADGHVEFLRHEEYARRIQPYMQHR